MKRIAKLLLVAALAAGAAAAQAGMGILWSTSGGWVVATGGDPDSGPGVAASDDVTWQLVYAGPDGTADAVDLSAADWVGGDDVLLAERSIPAGGGTAADGTSWDDWLIQQGGDATYVDLDWSADRGGYVFQRIFQGTPSEGAPYAESGLFAFDPAFAGGPGALTDNFSFPEDGNVLVLDRTIPTTLKTYPLWVGGVQVCETNKNDILGDGTASFEGAATGGTLALSNATITATHAFEKDYESLWTDSANVFSGEGFDLAIMLVGTNILQNADHPEYQDQGDSYGVRSQGDLAITGDGALVAWVEYNGAGIDTDGDLLVDGAVVTAHSGQDGFNVLGDLAISNAVVTADGAGYNGICGDGDIVIADSVVTATGWAGIEADGHTVAVSGASVVTAEATWGDESEWALCASALVLGDGLAIAEPAGGAFDADEWCVIDASTGAPAKRVVIDRRFAVTVEGGSTTNSPARAGKMVTVVANPPEEGKAFVEWSPDDVTDVTFEPADAATTTFAMPARAVTVTAVFKEIQIDSIPDQEWTGGPVEPEFRSDTVKFEGTDMVLLPGTDYTVSYTNNVDPGTATATVTMAPPRTGSKSVTFQILPPPEPPSVSNVVARQRWPWNGLVDVDYEVGGDTNLLAGVEVRISFIASDGRSWVATNFLAGAEPSAEPGAHRATWNAASDAGAGVVASNVVATVALVRPPPPRWCVVDLSGGVDAASYPVAYFAEPPAGGWNADAYKTTNLVLRLVKPSDWADGTFAMRGGCEATLTNAYWIGVFETTQRQWELVKGDRPSYFRSDDCYATRPVEQVSYEMIRGSDAGSMWPDPGDVDDESFLGRLRARTGLAFDLPTEAQWEFACRAGTTTDYNNGTNLTDREENANLDLLGRYKYNGGEDGSGNRDCDPSGGTAAAGSYLPNKWGLYDCHGNVWEWCLDWYGALASGAVEPVGAPSGEYRVLRGGGWGLRADFCLAGLCGIGRPSSGGDDSGFRLCLTVGPEPAAGDGDAAAAASSAEFRLDTREGPFESDGTETLTYSSIWHGDTNATVTILQNGDEDEPVAAELAGEGDIVWQVFEDGTYVLTHVTTTNVAVSPVCNEETATFVVTGHPLVEAALRWKYAKNANGWHCAQVALTWHPSYADEISDMRLLFADRYEDSEPLAVIKVLDDDQAAFFEVPEMIKMAGDDWKYYFLNDENGKVFSERFLEGGYREKLEERPTVSDGDEAGSVSSWVYSDSTRYITNGVLNADGTSFSHGITVNGRTVTLKFASSPHGLGRRTAYLVDPASVVSPLGATETYRDVEYRVAPVDLTAFAGLADGARAVYGVSDETMDSPLASVPKSERKICLRVVNRDYSTVGRADNKLAILAWKVGGLPRFLPIAETMSSLQDGGGVHQPAQQPAPRPAPRPLSVAEANLSAAFGLAPTAVARGAVTCRVSSMSFGEDGSVEGTFAVAAENAGGVVAESGELAGNVKLTVLGAERLGGAFEPLDDSCGAELLSRKPPYAFRVKAPGAAAFFKVRLEAEDVFE